MGFFTRSVEKMSDTQIKTEFYSLQTKLSYLTNRGKTFNRSQKKRFQELFKEGDNVRGLDMFEKFMRD